VFDINGTEVANQYYMSSNGADDAACRNNQIRLYRGDLKCGNTSTGNYYQLQHGSNVILANVFNGCSGAGWTVKIYENDTAYDMTYVKEEPYQPGGDNNIDVPSGFLTWYSPVNVPTDSNQDWWAIGYRACMAGLSGAASFVNCFHMYKHTIVDESATIRVEATDPYGRTYVQTDIIENGEDIYASIER
ncbi:MAG: calcineurin-like phosphoesterase C-terminal domain-containing protein, partial [Rikenellaceae bacterium]|nr:calcineurin-like phosphoesterase C-terminal domain-containing protein [Rikenellaceae bacterium]